MGENMKSRIIVCGGRHYEDYEQLERIVDQVISEMNLDLTEVEIVSGHCAGADQLGERYAKEHGAKCSIFPAQWHIYGRCRPDSQFPDGGVRGRIRVPGCCGILKSEDQRNQGYREEG